MDELLNQVTQFATAIFIGFTETIVALVRIDNDRGRVEEIEPFVQDFLKNCRYHFKSMFFFFFLIFRYRFLSLDG